MTQIGLIYADVFHAKAQRKKARAQRRTRFKNFQHSQPSLQKDRYPLRFCAPLRLCVKSSKNSRL